jgi:hypothetical protein
MRIALLGAILAGVAAATEPPTDPTAAARAAYQDGVRLDQSGFEDALRDLSRRFKTALERLHVDARDRGELEEALATKHLWDRVVPLATATVFAAGAPLLGPVRYPLPPAPPGKGLTAQAFTNYAGKVAVLVAQFNTAAGSRHSRFLSALSQLVKDQTKQGDLDGAVKLRDQHAAIEREGPLRLVVAVADLVPAAVASRGHAVLGNWIVRTDRGDYRRVFRADGTMEVFGPDGIPIIRSPYRIMDDTLVVSVHTNGFEDRCRLLPDGQLDILSKNPQGVRRVMRGLRVGNGSNDADAGL